jgi:hypothetical protein
MGWMIAAFFALAVQAQSQVTVAGNVAPANPAVRPPGNSNSASGPVLNSSLNTLDGAEPAVGAAPVVETNGPLHTCDDGVSAALQQDAPNMPCWANIRTVDHWNSLFIPDGVSFRASDTAQIPQDVQSSFAYTASGLSAFGLPDGDEAKVYGGLVAGDGLIEKHRWQMMIEDASGAGDYQLGGAHFAHLNRFATRATGELNEQWTWQANATNTYGTDGLRLFAPLDYRMIGQAEAPAPDTISYGLHGGNLMEQAEGTKLRYASSERSHWDFSANDTYRHYWDDGFGVQTVQGRAEYLHAVTRDTAIGFYGEGADQTINLDCELGGGGARLLTQFKTGASLNVTAGVYGASASCGKQVQFQGDAALYLPLGGKTDAYFATNRGLGDGIFEHTTFLDSGSAGVRHTFHQQLSTRIAGAMLYGTDPKTNASLHGSFVDATVRYPLPLGFSQEMAIRHYALSGVGATPNRTIGVITLWWSPTKHRSEGQ